MKNVPGFLLSGVSAGLKKNGKKDLALIFSTAPARTAAIFTKNLIKGAPLLVAQERLGGGFCQALIINSVNANAFTGQRGYEDALSVANALSARLGIDESLVIPSSTGVTGERLRIGKIKKSIPMLIKGLGEDNVREAAEAIMTTDSFPKYASRQFAAGEKTATVSAIGKGAGMICPDMATMLCFIMTDLNISAKLSQRLLQKRQTVLLTLLRLMGTLPRTTPFLSSQTGLWETGRSRRKAGITANSWKHFRLCAQKSPK